MDVYDKIPKRKGHVTLLERRKWYFALLEKRIRELESIVARFGCYEDGHPITCLHCPEADRCEARYESIL